MRYKGRKNVVVETDTEIFLVNEISLLAALCLLCAPFGQLFIKKM